MPDSTPAAMARQRSERSGTVGREGRQRDPVRNPYRRVVLVGGNLQAMEGYGQFCSIARALDVLGERWSLFIIRELLCGSRRFSEIQRGIPRISRTMLSARLRELVDLEVVGRSDGEAGPTYDLTDSGRELEGVVRELGTWGQRWLPRALHRDELDADFLLWDMRRRVNLDALPTVPIVTRIELSDQEGRTRTRYLLLRRTEVSLCSVNPGFPETLRVRAPLRTLVGWWRGDFSFADARHAGLVLEGRRVWVRSFANWFQKYAFAAVSPAESASEYGFRTNERRRRG